MQVPLRFENVMTTAAFNILNSTQHIMIADPSTEPNFFPLQWKGVFETSLIIGGVVFVLIGSFWCKIPEIRWLLNFLTDLLYFQFQKLHQASERTGRGAKHDARTFNSYLSGKEKNNRFWALVCWFRNVLNWRRNFSLWSLASKNVLDFVRVYLFALQSFLLRCFRKKYGSASALLNSRYWTLAFCRLSTKRF